MRRGKVLIAILGLDQHEVGAMTSARAVRDAGLEVVYNGRFNLPPALVQSALEEDVDVIGLSAHSWDYLCYLDEILDRLRGTFGPSCTTNDVVRAIRELVEARVRADPSRQKGGLID
jgi:methylmalonyl-CoA mutase cobalamin-binding domain/chain